jgi:hypothetical protein
MTDTRTCGSCGTPLAPDASFCRSCGAQYEQPACDACQAPIVPGTAFCRSCGAPVSSPSPAPATPADPEPTLVQPPPPPAAAPPPRPREGSRRTPLLIAAVIVLLGVAAAAVVVIGGGKKDSSSTTVAADHPGSASASGEEEIPAAEETGYVEGDEDGFPAVSESEMDEEIESLLFDYHEYIVERDFRSAWALLSARKRQQDLADYGYRGWRRGQESLSDYLSPSGLRTHIESLEDEGVARVMITGMGWSAPTASCGEWSGLTWVRYEGGEWTYDPGYSTTSSRRQTWKPRSSELLGENC